MNAEQACLKEMSSQA